MKTGKRIDRFIEDAVVRFAYWITCISRTPGGTPLSVISLSKRWVSSLGILRVRQW